MLHNRMNIQIHNFRFMGLTPGSVAPNCQRDELANVKSLVLEFNLVIF
jgi:hypothetical protein